MGVWRETPPLRTQLAGLLLGLGGGKKSSGNARGVGGQPAPSGEFQPGVQNYVEALTAGGVVGDPRILEEYQCLMTQAKPK